MPFHHFVTVELCRSKRLGPSQEITCLWSRLADFSQGRFVPPLLWQWVASAWLAACHVTCQNILGRMPNSAWCKCSWLVLLLQRAGIREYQQHLSPVNISPNEFAFDHTVRMSEEDVKEMLW